jgi:ubiquinone/menaquinone biosynthesis C-methylase UbiE
VLPLLPADERDRYAIQLYHHVATDGGARSLAGARVVEVGCGRGGGASYVARNLAPAALDAVDLSSVAVAACARRYAGVTGLRFLQGDAERLPFPDASCDVVLNVESSHCYGDLPRFLSEVRRVLKPGGTLRMADFRRPELVDAWLAALDNSGLMRVTTEDITQNVVAGLDADDARKVQTIADSGVPQFLQSSLRQFAGCRGSTMYDSFARRERLYLRFVLVKQ